MLDDVKAGPGWKAQINKMREASLMPGAGTFSKTRIGKEKYNGHAGGRHNAKEQEPGASQGPGTLQERGSPQVHSQSP